MSRNSESRSNTSGTLNCIRDVSYVQKVNYQQRPQHLHILVEVMRLKFSLRENIVLCKQVIQNKSKPLSHLKRDNFQTQMQRSIKSRIISERAREYVCIQILSQLQNYSKIKKRGVIKTGWISHIPLHRHNKHLNYILGTRDKSTRVSA